MMKTKITRLSKRSMSMILAFLMMLSVIGSGSLINSSAADVNKNETGADSSRTFFVGIPNNWDNKTNWSFGLYTSSSATTATASVNGSSATLVDENHEYWGEKFDIYAVNLSNTSANYCDITRDGNKYCNSGNNRETVGTNNFIRFGWRWTAMYTYTLSDSVTLSANPSSGVYVNDNVTLSPSLGYSTYNALDSTTYTVKWDSASGSTCISGTDYTISNGVFTPLKQGTFYIAASSAFHCKGFSNQSGTATGNTTVSVTGYYVSSGTSNNGGNAAFSSSAWGPSDSDALLTKTGTNTYAKTFTNVTAGTYYYKVTHGTWDTSYPADNKAITVPHTGDSVTITYNNSTHDVTDSITHQSYTVTLNTNGGTINAGNVTSYTCGTGATLPTNVTKTGYTFSGWYESSNLSGSAVSSISTSVSGNKSYWAKWTANQYTITYKDGGNTTFSGTHASGYPTKHTYGTATTLKTATKSGYRFDGWFTTSNCSGTAVTSLGATTYTDNITLYAKWTAVYGITTVNGSYGTLSASPTTAVSGGTVTFTAAVTNSAYNFDGVDITKSSGGEAVTTIAASSFSNTTSGGTYSYTMPGAYAITATARYAIKTYAITLSETGATGGEMLIDGTVRSSGYAVTHSSHTFRVNAPSGYEISAISGLGATWTNSESYATSNSVSITGTGTISVTYIRSTKPALKIDYTGSGGATYTTTNGDSVITTNQHNVTATFTNQDGFDNGTAYSWQYTKNGTDQGSGSGTTSSSGGNITVKSSAKLASGTWVFSVTVGNKTTSITVVVNAAYKIVVPAANTNSSLSTGVSNSYYISAFTNDETTAINAAGTYYSKSGKAYQVKYTISSNSIYTFNSDGTNNATSTFSGTVTSSGVTITAPTVYERQYSLTLNKKLGSASATTMATAVSLKTVTGQAVNYTAQTGYTISSWTVTDGTVYVGNTSYASGSTINTAGNLSNVTIRAAATIQANFTEDKYSVTLTDALHSASTTTGAVGIATSYSVTAADKDGYTFTSWTVTGTGVTYSTGSASTASITFTARSNVTLVANYTETTHNITIAAETCGTTALGEVVPTSGSAGIDTGLSATATAYTGFEFKEWTGSNLTFTPNSATTTIKSTGGTAATANFRQTRLYLDVNANSTWSGASYYKIYFYNNGGDYNTGTDKHGFVDMTAVPNTTGLYYGEIPSGYIDALTGSHGFIFVAKSDNDNDWDNKIGQTGNLDFDGKKNRYTIPASGDLNNTRWEANAYIMETYYDVDVTVTAGGSITYNDSDVSNGDTISVSQTARTLVATPAAGYVFSGWTTTGGAKVAGGTTSSSATVGATATANGTLTATFTAVSHTINTSDGAYYTVSSNRASGILDQNVTITVSPSTGYTTTSITATWSGGSSIASSSNSNTLTFNIPAKSENESINITVSCDVITPTISLTYHNSASGTTTVSSGSTKRYTGSDDSNTITFSNGTSYPSGASYSIKDGDTVLDSGSGDSNAAITTALAAGTHTLKVSVTLDGTTKTSGTITLVTKDKVTITLTEPAYGGRFKTSGKNVYNSTVTKYTSGTQVYAKGETITVTKQDGDGDLADVYVDGTSIGTGQQTFTADAAKAVTADFYANLYERGSNNSWNTSNTYRFKYTDTQNVYQLKINYAAAADQVSFKIYDSSSETWYTNSSLVATTDVTNANFNDTTSGLDNNAKFTPSAIGNYTFTFNRATSGSEKLSIEYPKFELSLGSHSNATVSGTYPADKAAGSTVSFTVTPDSGYSIARVTYTPEGGSATAIDNVPTAGGEVSFTMPTADTEIAVIAVLTPTVTPSSATLTKYAKQSFDLTYSTANSAEVTSISFAGESYTSSLSSPKSLTVPTDLGIDSPYTGTQTYTITINYRHSTYTNITGTATVTVNATYTATQQAYLMLKDLHTKYSGYGIDETDTVSGFDDGLNYSSKLSAANTALTGASPLPEYTVNSPTTYKGNSSSPYEQLQSAYNAIVFKTNTLYVLTQYSANVKIQSSSNSSRSGWFIDKNTDNRINNTNTPSFYMTYEGETNSGKHLWSFTYYGKSKFIVFCKSGTSVYAASAKLSGTINITGSSNDYGEYYTDLKDAVAGSGNSPEKSAWSDFAMTDYSAGGGTLSSDLLEKDHTYSLSDITGSGWLNISTTGSLVNSSQTVNESFTIRKVGTNDNVTLDSTHNWTPSEAGRYRLAYSAAVGVDERSGAGANFEVSKTYYLYVAYDEVTIYADMNGNIGIPTIYFDYRYEDPDNAGSYIAGTLPYEMELMTGSETTYSTVVSLKTLKNYDLDLLAMGSIDVSKFTVDTDEYGGFIIDIQAAKTGTVWMKANSSSLTGFDQIAYSSSNKTFKAKISGASTYLSNSFADVSGTGVITDEELTEDNGTVSTSDDYNYYNYNVYYAALDDSEGTKPGREKFNGDGSTKTFTLSIPSKVLRVSKVKVGSTAYTSSQYTFNASTKTITFTSAPASGTKNIIVDYEYVSKFSYKVTAVAEEEIISSGTTYCFDHWEWTENSENQTSIDKTLTFTSAPVFEQTDDITYVAVYVPVSSNARVEITYNFKDYDTSDGNYVYDSSKTLKDEKYVKTILLSKLTGNITSVTTSNAASIAGQVQPKIMSNYFDYTYNSSQTVSSVTDASSSNNYKYKFSVNMTQKAHKYKIVYGINTYTGYYQQSQPITANSSVNWYITQNGQKFYIGNGQTYNAKFGMFQDSGTDGEFKYDSYTVYTETGNAITNRSNIVTAHQETYYDDNGTQKARHNFYIIDTITDTPDDSSTRKFVGGGVVYATLQDQEIDSADENTVFTETVSGENHYYAYRQSSAASTLDTTGHIQIYINGILNGTYSTEYKAQSINNIGFRYLPYEKGEDVFRYSNALSAYQYVFAGENTNSSSLSGQKLMVYSFFVYKTGNTYTTVVSNTFAQVNRYISG